MSTPTPPPALLANLPALVVDDEPSIVRSMEAALRTIGVRATIGCTDAPTAATIVEERPLGIVLLDLVMPSGRGEDLLDRIVALHRNIPVVVITAVNDVEIAVSCMRRGAFDYLVKPVDFGRLSSAVLRASEIVNLRDENRQLRDSLLHPAPADPELFAPLLTRDPAMLALFRYVESVAKSDAPVLISGETGVGKELLAQALHRASGRSGPLTAVNVAGLDDTAFSDTLFGHVRGAFTGADRARAGLVEGTADGTLLLDEIGELSTGAQVRLLRFLERGEFYPLGSDTPRRGRCRVVALTNRDVARSVAAGTFRGDLYYRLCSHALHVPPLRDRRGDIPLLLQHFLADAARSFGKSVPTPPRELLDTLGAYAFPGNVRELRAMVHDAVGAHAGHVLSLDRFLVHMRTRQAAVASLDDPPVRFGSSLPTVNDAMAELMREALRRTNGNQSAAARILDVSRRTIGRFAATNTCELPDA